MTWEWTRTREQEMLHPWDGMMVVGDVTKDGVKATVAKDGKPIWKFTLTVRGMSEDIICLCTVYDPPPRETKPGPGSKIWFYGRPRIYTSRMHTNPAVELIGFGSYFEVIH